MTHPPYVTVCSLFESVGRFRTDGILSLHRHFGCHMQRAPNRNGRPSCSNKI